MSSSQSWLSGRIFIPAPAGFWTWLLPHVAGHRGLTVPIRSNSCLSCLHLHLPYVQETLLWYVSQFPLWPVLLPGHHPPICSPAIVFCSGSSFLISSPSAERQFSKTLLEQPTALPSLFHWGFISWNAGIANDSTGQSSYRGGPSVSPGIQRQRLQQLCHRHTHYLNSFNLIFQIYSTFYPL